MTERSPKKKKPKNNNTLIEISKRQATKKAHKQLAHAVTFNIKRKKGTIHKKAGYAIRKQQFDTERKQQEV